MTVSIWRGARVEFPREGENFKTLIVTDEQRAEYVMVQVRHMKDRRAMADLRDAITRRIMEMDHDGDVPFAAGDF